MCVVRTVCSSVLYSLSLLVRHASLGFFWSGLIFDLILQGRECIEGGVNKGEQQLHLKVLSSSMRHSAKHTGSAKKEAGRHSSTHIS